MYDYVNVRLNEYVRTQQFHVLKQSLIEYALQTDFLDLKERVGGILREFDHEAKRKEEISKKSEEIMEKLN